MTNAATQVDFIEKLKQPGLFDKLTLDTQSFTKGRSGLSLDDEKKLIQKIKDVTSAEGAELLKKWHDYAETFTDRFKQSADE